MQDKVLHNTLSQRMKSFYEEYFDRAPENRFEAFLAGGHRSLPVMLDCLESDEADAEARTDALIAIGRVFEANGPTADALDMVVHHAKRMAETINVIKSAESGKPPTDAVIRKFEMILGISLMVESTNEHESMVGRSGQSRGMTIGDYLKDLR